MGKNIIIILVVLVLVLGGYFLFQANVASQNQVVPQEQSQTNPPPGDTLTVTLPPIVQIKHEVTYTDAGFSPATLTVKEGETVVFKNESSGGMWVGSAMHPSHMVYSGTTLQQHCPDTLNTSFDECKSDAPGTSWSFTFAKKGSFGYHNHVKASTFGKIIVE